MQPAQILQAALVAGMILCADLQSLIPAQNETVPKGAETQSEYFEGRWAFSEETCDMLTNWTLLAGGNFISEDLTGTWEWIDGKLILGLTDLAIDEETGEAGGRFQMDGPVTVTDANNFNFKIAPDVYQMKRCLTD